MMTLAPLTERELMQTAIDLARRYRWLVFHAYDSRRSEPGLPDLLCVRDDRLVAIECKSAKGRVTKAQWHWLRALDQVRRATSIVLRPLRPLRYPPRPRTRQSPRRQRQP